MSDTPKATPLKRSSRVALSLMASSSVALVAGCGRSEPVEAERYQTLDQCLADGALSEQACQQSYQEALAEHQASAPRYDSQAACEAQFGPERCQRQSGSQGSFWTPFFMGWIASSLLDRAVDGRRYAATPVYQPWNTRRWYTPTGTVLNPTSDGSYRVARRSLAKKPPVAKVRSRTGAVSRGGFTSRSSRSYRGYGG
ncbi:MAG: DUF1190 domain-containing protein [Rhodothalassiaceae bacterium]